MYFRSHPAGDPQHDRTSIVECEFSRCEFRGQPHSHFKHLKILTECGLVVVRQGRERYCEARLKKLSKVSDWVERYRSLWEAKFDSLEAYLGKLQAKKKRHEKKKG